MNRLGPGCFTGAGREVPSTSGNRTTAAARSDNNRDRVGLAYKKHLQKKDVLSTITTRQLQLASGGRYKFFLLSKIYNFMKQQFLGEAEKRMTLDQLLAQVQEPDVSGDLKEWLLEEGLPSHPKVRVLELHHSDDKRFAYKPPIPKLKFESQLLNLLKSMHDKDEGGLLRSSVEDSMPLADMHLKSLLNQGKIIEISRIDTRKVLFYKAPIPESQKLTVDKRFAELWRKVDVSNKAMHQMKLHLKNKRITVIDDEALDREDFKELFGDGDSATSKPKRKKATAKPSASKPRKRKIKDNAHVLEELQDLRLDDEESSPAPTTSPVRRSKRSRKQ